MKTIELSSEMKTEYISSLYECFNTGRNFEIFLNYFFAENRISEIICNNECYSLDQLAVSGNDIINEFGVYGKIVGEYLEKLLVLVCCGKLENDKKTLLEYLKKMESK